MSKRRVVITGAGMISPLGNQAEKSWQNALAGQSGIRLIDSSDMSDFTTKFAGIIQDFDPTLFMSAKEARKCDIFVQYGVAASVEAVKLSGLMEMSNLDLERVGVSIGSGIGGIGTIELNQNVLSQSGPKRISPFFIPGSIINMVSGHVSIINGFKGPNLAVATACTTGTHSIGLALRCIEYGDADVMIAGGAEYASTPLGIAGFAAARALSTRNDDPAAASRPWDRNRDGFVLGDGAGVVVLEELEHAKRRGATIIAEVIGFGMSSDAFHITRPSGVGAVSSMKNAMKDAKVSASDIDYINAHGTSTPAGDLEEARAIKTALQDAASKVSVSSTKSMTGHLLGAAGAVEAIYTAFALRDQVAPPTINLDEPDEECDLDFVPHQAKPLKMEVAMSNSFGFGGTNGTLILKRFSE